MVGHNPQNSVINNWLHTDLSTSRVRSLPHTFLPRSTDYAFPRPSLDRALKEALRLSLAFLPDAPDLVNRLPRGSPILVYLAVITRPIAAQPPSK